MRKTGEEIGKNENVILDLSGLTKDQAKLLSDAVALEAGWAGRIVFWP